MAAEILLAKRGVRPGLTRAEAEESLLVAMNWHTYRALTGMRGLTPSRAPSPRAGLTAPVAAHAVWAPRSLKTLYQ